MAGNSLTWTGDPEAGRPYLGHALSLCSPNSVSSSIVSFLNLQTVADTDFAHGRRYYTKSGYFTYLDDSSIDRLVEAVSSMPSSETQIELAHLGGAAAPMAAKATAFGGLFNTLRPAMKPGGYVNFMSGDEQHRVQEAYQERWDRMVAVKTHYDPNSFFRLNQNVPPKKLAMTLPASHGET